MPMSVALPPGWKKPSAAFASADKRSSLPWDGLVATSPGPNTSVQSTINNGSARPSRASTFARAHRFSEPPRSPGPADYAHSHSPRSLGLSASGAHIGYATRIELPWEAEAKEAGTIPGPGAYQPPIVDMVLRRSASGPFASHSPRFKPEQPRSPGAACYSPRGHEMAHLDGSLALKTSSVFASATARELQLVKGEVLTVGPGQYEAFALQSLSADASKAAAHQSAAFHSHTERFRPTTKGSGLSPGPAAYSPRKKTEYSTTSAYSNHASF